MLNRSRIPLPRVIEALEDDPEFVSQALRELAFIDRVSTYSSASAVIGLFRHWLVEGDLNCYSRRKIVEDVAAMTVSEIGGSFDLSIAALEDGLLIDRSELLVLLKDRGFDLPEALGADDKTISIPEVHSWSGIEAEHEQARRKSGRYQIREAAEQLQIHAGERADTMIDKLSKAAFEGNLPVHLPGEKARHAYPQDGMVHRNVSTLPGGVSYFVGTDWRQHVRDFYEEAYWDDLNAWLSENEPRIDWRFPNPNQLSRSSSTKSLRESEALEKKGAGPLQRQRFQEQEIIRALSDLGYEPQAIPKWKAGERGVKSTVREFLKAHNWSEKVFDKAWQRLRDCGEIAEI